MALEELCMLGYEDTGYGLIPYKARTDDWWWADIQALYWQCDESQLLFDWCEVLHQSKHMSAGKYSKYDRGI